MTPRPGLLLEKLIRQKPILILSSIGGGSRFCIGDFLVDGRNPVPFPVRGKNILRTNNW